MKRNDPTVILAGFAHAITWAVALFMVFGPVYQGVAITPATPGGVASESTRFTATLTAENGLILLLLLLAPMVLTGLALLAVLLTHAGQARRKSLLWLSAFLLLGFCAVGIFSIGMFYLPAALALVFSAHLRSRGRGAGTRAG